MLREHCNVIHQGFAVWYFRGKCVVGIQCATKALATGQVMGRIRGLLLAWQIDEESAELEQVSAGVHFTVNGLNVALNLGAVDEQNERDSFNVEEVFDSLQ